jgi:hypothetical protein
VRCTPAMCRPPGDRLRLAAARCAPEALAMPARPSGHLPARRPARVDLHSQPLKYVRFVRLAAQSAAVPRRVTSLSTGSVTRTAWGTSRPTGRSSTTTRPSTSTTRSTRCACGSSSRTTSPVRRSRAATSVTGTSPAYEASRDFPRLTSQQLLSVTDDPTAAPRYPSFGAASSARHGCALSAPNNHSRAALACREVFVGWRQCGPAGRGGGQSPGSCSNRRA